MLYAIVGDAGILIGKDGWLAITTNRTLADRKIQKMKEFYPKEEYLKMKVGKITFEEISEEGRVKMYAVVGVKGVKVLESGCLAISRRKEVAMTEKNEYHVIVQVKDIELYL